jgi:alkylhydroperoxidase/carboxymuconolactone decarboxylase family protein YurZ
MMVKVMNENPFEILKQEFPELAASLGELVETQKSLKGIDNKTKQLLNIAIQTANRNPTGVQLHASMAKIEGASREEVLGAVVLNLHHSGLASVMECLPKAVKGFENHFEGP